MTATANRARWVPQSGRPSLGLGLVVAMMLCAMAVAAAQQPATQPAPAAPAQQAAPAETPPPAAAPAPPPNEGLFGTIGRWVSGSIARLGAPWKDKSEAAPGAADATGGIGSLSKAKVVSGHERCEIATNGAPDCRRAIEALCRSKGLAAGNSLNIESVQKCSARAWISGGRTSSGECWRESYVQSAVCR